MDFLKYIKKGRARHCEPKPLRIDGVKTTMTPQPDDAELAAQALLESMSGNPKKSRKGKAAEPRHGTPEYYRQLSEKIRQARAAEARRTMRYLAYCEQQLDAPAISHHPSAIEDLERGLYLHQDTAEREGGELLRRWQHCLAEVIVRQMSAAGSLSDDDGMPGGDGQQGT